jgi:thioredoxin reductase (NADPH)
MKPIMYEGLQPGGQLTITTEVDNFPGYPNGTQGPQMMEDLKAQAARFGTDIRFGLITKVDFSKHPFEVVADEKNAITANTIIIATGASAKWLGLESEQKFNGFGVSACAVCDGFFFRGQEVAIVGAGDTAAEEASYLAKLCKKVTMLVRKGEMKASKAMQHRVMNTPNIEILYNTQTLEILGEQGVNGVKIINTVSQEESILSVTGFFVAIGHTPNSQIFSGQLTMDAEGYIQTIPGSSKTNIEGIFACGDVQDKTYRQAVTAAGSGCMAALDAERWLAAKGIH